jgi:hypothetical protein
MQPLSCSLNSTRNLIGDSPINIVGIAPFGAQRYRRGGPKSTLCLNFEIIRFRVAHIGRRPCTSDQIDARREEGIRSWNLR